MQKSENFADVIGRPSGKGAMSAKVFEAGSESKEGRQGERNPINTPRSPETVDR